MYERQNELGMEIPRKVIVIGCGGVGSWVGLFASMVGVEQLYLIDPDTIEEHNLNRTPFKLDHIGISKVEALKELILDRIDCEVNVYDCLVEQCEIPSMQIADAMIIDCRDDSTGIEQVGIPLRFTGGYDGRNITLHFNKDQTEIWGEEGMMTYTVSSYLVPPVILGALIIEKLIFPNEYKEEILFSGTISEMINRIGGRNGQKE